MGVTTADYESFEQQFLELIVEFQTISESEARLREALRVESSRAETAEAARDLAQGAAAEARAAATASAAGTAHAVAALAKAQDDLAASKMQFELAERHRTILEEKCSDLSVQLDEAKRQVQKLRPLQMTLSGLQRQYTELQESVRQATQAAQRETSRLENELRRVEKCASGGAEVRDRARLAAAAHVREKRLAAEELQHTSRELHTAKMEVTKLAALVAELQCRLSTYNGEKSTKADEDPNLAVLTETRAALEAERSSTARLEQALSKALADNATLAAQLHTIDNASISIVPQPTPNIPATNSNCPIDSFLAE